MNEDLKVIPRVWKLFQESPFRTGDLVLLKGEGDKHKVRDTYIVCGPGPLSRPNTIKIRKFLHMLDTTVPGKIMRQTYLVKPSQLIKYLAACSDLSGSESSSCSSSLESEEETFSRIFRKTYNPSECVKVGEVPEALVYSSDEDYVVKKNIRAPARPSSRQEDDEPEDLGHSTDLILFSSPEESAGDLVPLYQGDNMDLFIDSSPPNNPQVWSENFDVRETFGQLQLSSDSDNSNLFRNQHHSREGNSPELKWDD